MSKRRSTRQPAKRISHALADPVRRPPPAAQKSRAWWPFRVPGALCIGLLLGLVLPQGLRLWADAPRLQPAAARNADRQLETRPAWRRRTVPAAAQQVDHSEYAYSAAAFARLDRVRQQKKEAITGLLSDVAAAAERSAADERMLAWFHELHVAGAAGRDGQSGAAERLRESITEYYAYHYWRFYDVLFVDPQRYVFFSIRCERDYQSCIAEGSPLARGLRDCLGGSPHPVVVDYHDYAPSGQPSAFVVVPVLRDGVHEGWFVLQYAIRMLDALMVDRAELGDTGEVYLVNRDRMMLTDSRFTGEPTHLEYPVESVAAVWPTDDRPRRGLMRDYRGVRVFATVERVDVLGQEWALVAQLDEAEVITDFYRANREACLARILASLAQTPPPVRACPEVPAAARLVNMDEFRKAGPAGALRTQGVSTCTAVAIGYPGRFSYLAHISPYDKIYGGNRLTNILKQLVTRIRRYDIYPSELCELRATVIAPHADSVAVVLDKLLRYGLTLEQIRFVYRPQARHANLLVRDGGAVTVEWVLAADGDRVVHHAADLPDLASLVRSFSRVGKTDE